MIKYTIQTESLNCFYMIIFWQYPIIETTKWRTISKNEKYVAKNDNRIEDDIINFFASLLLFHLWIMAWKLKVVQMCIECWTLFTSSKNSLQKIDHLWKFQKFVIIHCRSIQFNQIGRKKIYSCICWFDSPKIKLTRCTLFPNCLNYFYLHQSGGRTFILIL